MEVSDQAEEIEKNAESAENAANDDNQSDASSQINEDSDEYIQKCAASLAIGVGSISDPAKFPGLSHFLEHMIFMGNEKYPDENSFDDFVEQHGGFSNAFTSAFQTNFYFDILPEHFDEALDRFSQFFVSPLIRKDAIEREVTAVNSEFEMSYTKNSIRVADLISNLAKSDSPFRQFSMGSKQSLLEDPKKKGLDTYEFLHTHRRNYYSANLMALALQSTFPLDKMESLAREFFEKIPNNGKPAPTWSHFDQPYMSTEFPKLYYMKPIGDENNLYLSWTCVPVEHEYEAKPHEFVCSFLCNSCSGSLEHFLKNKNLCFYVTANSPCGDDFLSNSLHHNVRLSFSLTKFGWEQIDYIIEATFAYVNCLYGAANESDAPHGIFQEDYFREFEQIAENSLRFRSMDRPSDAVVEAATNLHYYKPEHLISGDYVMSRRDPQLCRRLLAQMIPSASNFLANFNVIVCSHYFNTIKQFDKKTPYYNVEYFCEEFSAEQIHRWTTHPNIRICKGQSGQSQPRDTTADLYLPALNKFTTSNFEVLPLPASSCNTQTLSTSSSAMAKASIPPVLLENNSSGKLWYKLDEKYRIPKAVVQLCLKYQRFPTLKETVMIRLITSILSEHMNTELNDAIKADLNYKVSASKYWLHILVSGFNQKLPLLLECMVDTMASFADWLTPDTFDAQKESLRQEYKRIMFAPEKFFHCIVEKVLSANTYFVTDQMSELRNITFEDLIGYSQVLFGGGKSANQSGGERWPAMPFYVICYAHGNLSQSEARHMFQYPQRKLQLEQSNSSIVDCVTLQKIRKFEEGRVTHFRCLNPNPKNKNTVATIVLQLDYLPYPTAEAEAQQRFHQETAILKQNFLINFLTHVIGEKAFNELRTKQTLGYSVYFRNSELFCHNFFNLVVVSQSDKFSLDHCFKRMVHFMDEFVCAMLDPNRAAKSSISSKKHQQSEGEEATEKAGETKGNAEVEDMFETLSARGFSEYLSSFRQSLQVETTKMSQEAARNWSEIQLDKLQFNRNLRVLAMLNGEREGDAARSDEEWRAELFRFYQTHCKFSSSCRRLFLGLDQLVVLNDSEDDSNKKKSETAGGEKQEETMEAESEEKKYDLELKVLTSKSEGSLEKSYGCFDDFDDLAVF